MQMRFQVKGEMLMTITTKGSRTGVVMTTMLGHFGKLLLEVGVSSLGQFIDGNFELAIQ